MTMKPRFPVKAGFISYGNGEEHVVISSSLLVGQSLLIRIELLTFNMLGVS